MTDDRRPHLERAVNLFSIRFGYTAVVKQLSIGFRWRALLSAAACCVIAVSGPARADLASEAPEAPDADPRAIVVTARKVPEALIDAPLSLSVKTASDLDAPRFRDLSGLATTWPNAAMSGGIAGQLQGQIAVRGIATLVRNIGVESGIGIYVDDVYSGRPESYNLALLDVERAELLRGPQGTVYGKNTIAGVFNIVSKQPTADAEASARVDFGNYNLVRLQGVLSGPVAGEALRARLAVGWTRRDGFDRHIAGGADADDADELSWRGTLVAEPSEALTLTLRTDGLRDRSVPGYYASTDIGQPGFVLMPGLPPRQIDNNRPNRLSRDIEGVSLTAALALGDSNLTSISAYRSTRYRASLDTDQQRIDLLSADMFGDRTKILTQELRLNGPLGKRLRYVAGLYFFDQQVSTDRVLAVGADFHPLIPAGPRLTTRGTVDTRSYSGFGTIDWMPSDRWVLSAGARITHERKTARFAQDDETGIFTAAAGLPDILFAGTSRDDNLSPTVSVTYRPASRVRVYARIARGFKSAAYNVDLAQSPDGLTAGAERATTYEAGVKAELDALSARLALAAFHTDYADLQVAQLTGGSTVLSNAASASIDGFEAELSLSPVSGLRLEMSAGYADGRYDRFAGCALPLSEGGGSGDCSGNRLSGAPRFTAGGMVEYGRDIAAAARLTGSVSAHHRSAVYFEPTNSPRFRGRPRTLVDAQLTLALERFSLSAWVQNLTDETYEAYRDDRSAIGVLRTTAYGAPRTYGLTVSARY